MYSEFCLILSCLLNNLKKASCFTSYSFYLERFSKKNFAENKLSPSLFSLSPLFKFHPSFLQQTPVQPSNLFVLGIPLEFE